MSYFMGIDLARIHDKSAVVIVDRDDVGLHRIIGAIDFQGNWKDQTRRIKDIALRVDVHPKLRLICVDRTGIGDVIFEDLVLSSETGPMLNNVIPVVFSNELKERMIQVLTGMLERGILKPERRMVKLRTQAVTQRYEQRLDKVHYEHPEGTHDDLLWALCLALWASRSSPS